MTIVVVVVVVVFAVVFVTITFFVSSLIIQKVTNIFAFSWESGD